MISKEDYSVCKCAINRDRMVKVLVRFCHEMIKHGYFRAGG